MKRMKSNRVFALIIALIMMATIIPIGAIASDNDIGKEITMGIYNGNPIKWTCAGKDENGYLMVANEVICEKAFDAASPNHSDAWSGIRQRYGSNNWNSSCIRKWLNSEGIIDWTKELAIPSSENVSTGVGYEEEQGFLSCFTSSELSTIKEVNNKSYLNSLDFSLSDGGEGEYDVGRQPFSSFVDDVANHANDRYQYSSDRVFLLGPEQFAMTYHNLGEEFLDTATSYWLRLPANSGASFENEMAVYPGKIISYVGGTYSSDVGVRPAFYLASDPETEGGEIRGSFSIQGKGEYKGDNGFCYSDSYFERPSTIYNHSLATMSLCLAFSTYGLENNGIPIYEDYDKNVYDLLNKCGFCEGACYSQYSFNEEPTASSIGCAIGSKKLNDNTTLIAVAIRGGGYRSEWASNAIVGDSSLAYHFGFNDAADKVVNNIKTYISETSHNVKGRIKIWITGYSRAAATATQAAAKLNKASFDNVSFSKNDIYAYGFATPAGVIDDGTIHGRDYDNIFSIIDFNDLVPLVAPVEWNFDRYGTTLVFPYKETSDFWVYDNYINRVKSRMGKNGEGENNYLVDDFKNYTLFLGQPIKSVFNHDTMGVFLRKLIHHTVNALGTRDDYCDSIQNAMIAYMVSCEGQIDLKNVNVDDVIENMTGFLPEVITLIRKVIPEFLKNSPLLLTAIRNPLFDVHANPDYYLTWMRLMDSNYSDSMPVLWGDQNYRAITVDCPVDVLVYDQNNTLVASIVDDKPVEIASSPIVSSIDENDSKVVYLPISGDYHVEIIARDDCKVTYNINEYKATTGTQTRNVSYRSVSLAQGESLFGNVESFSFDEINSGADEGSNADYSLRDDKGAIIVSHDIAADEIDSYQYEVKLADSAHGSLFGGGRFTEGAFAKIVAIPNKGYHVESFYLNGEEIADDDLDDDPSTIRLSVNDDAIISAKFVKNAVAKIEVEKDFYEISLSDQKQIEVLCFDEEDNLVDAELSWASSDEGVVTINDEGVLKTVSAGEAVITVTADGVSKSISVSVMNQIASKNGVVKGPDGKWALYKDDKVNTSYTGIAKNEYGWWRIVEGYVDFNATGIYKNEFGWWRVEDGKVDFEADGIYRNEYGWWKTTDGKVTFDETGVFKNEYGWWRVKDSKVDFSADGIYKNEYGWWKTTGGKVTFVEDGVFKNEYGWWKVDDSKVDFKFTGIAKNKYGTWYVKNGKVDFTKNGKVKFEGKTYTVKNGKVQ